MLEKFNAAATRVQNFAFDMALKAGGKYKKDKIPNKMLEAFDYAYTHAPADDEATIRDVLQRTIDENDGAESLGYFWYGTFTVDDVMDMVKDLSDDQKQALRTARTSYQNNRIKTDWEKDFHGIEQPAPA